MEVGPEKVAVYGGIYMPEKEQLEAIRKHIIANAAQFEALLNSKDFVETYGTLHGDKNKLLPKEFQEAAKQQPLVYNKAFYFYNHMKAEVALKNDFANQVILRYKAGKPMADFLFAALTAKK
jgi:uncharacterized protein (DUF2461 family)